MTPAFSVETPMDANIKQQWTGPFGLTAEQAQRVLATDQLALAHMIEFKWQGRTPVCP